MKRPNALVLRVGVLVIVGLFAMPAWSNTIATGSFNRGTDTITFSFDESDTLWTLPDTLTTNPGNHQATQTDAITGAVVVCDQFDPHSDRCSVSNMSDIVIFDEKQLGPPNSPSTVEYYSGDETDLSTIDLSNYYTRYILEPGLKNGVETILWRPSYRDCHCFDFPGDATNQYSFGINNDGISYRYQFTSDGDAAATTPEPSTWLLFGQGLGVLGVAFRRLRKPR